MTKDDFQPNLASIKSLTMYRMLFVLCCLPGLACNSGKSPEALRQEVQDAERAFAEMAASAGVPEAFLAFAAEDVVLMRGNTLLHGKEEMQAYFAAGTLRDVRLQWEPAFVDVSKAGDLAYTYGPYTFSARDTSGAPVESTGFFHTVWKRQKDGTWKFVWD